MGLNPGFTLAEDAALKNRLAHLAVSDDRNNERPVQVFFRFPDDSTEKTYPFITIDLMDISFDPQRALSEVSYYYSSESMGASVGTTHLPIDYYPSELTSSQLETLSEGKYLRTEQFVPVNLMYQVTTYCRSQRHDRTLTMLLLRRVFPMRRGFIDIPEDGTVRRLDLLDWRQSDLLDQETGYKKRIYRKVLTVRITADIPQSDFEHVEQVLETAGSLTQQASDNTVQYPLLEDFNA